jgi:hypothetical protein
VAIKALARGLPGRRGLPLSHWSIAESRQEAVASGIVALDPWHNPGAGSARMHCGPGIIAPGYSRATHSLPARLVAPSSFTSAVGKVQQWGRSIPPAPQRPIYVEHESARAGALAYLADWDVHRARLSGRCERKNGIAAFERLVAQVMGQQPYRSAGRVFLITDNGSPQRGPASRCPTASQVAKHRTGSHTDPCQLAHRIEVYLSIVQRKLFTASDFADLAALKHGPITPKTLSAFCQAVPMDLHAPRSARACVSASPFDPQSASKFDPGRRSKLSAESIL